MAANVITVNHSKELEWYVGDSKMDDLLKLLDVIGVKATQGKEGEIKCST